MKARKYMLRFAMVIFGLLFLISLSLKYSLASNNTRISLIEGLKKINIDTYSLFDMRKKRYEKLEEDLAYAKAHGLNKVASDSTFYLLNKTPFTGSELDEGLKGTNLEGLGEDFKSAEIKYGVNAILLMAMAKHETGNGQSELFNNKNNLFGFNAIDSDPYNKASHYESPKESIDDVAYHLKNEYLDKDGSFYNGVSSEAIGLSYATDPDWSVKVNYMMIEVAETIIESYEAGN